MARLISTSVVIRLQQFSRDRIAYEWITTRSQKQQHKPGLPKMKNVSSRRTFLQSFTDARALLDKGKPREAVAVARRAAATAPVRSYGALSLAGILIDAGADLDNLKWIREGIRLLQSNTKFVNEEQLPGFHYNLGNGFLALGDRERGRGPGTRPSLSHAVSHFDESLRLRPSTDTRTNLGGTFIAQGRWIEALDELDEVLTNEPGHHTALAKRAEAYIAVSHWMWPHIGLLQAALLDLEQAVGLAQDQPVFLRSYQSTLMWLRQRVRRPACRPGSPTRTEAWIWRQRLSLNVCPLCRIQTPNAFDTFPLANLLKGGKRRPSVEEVIDIINSLNRSFTAARWCLLQAEGLVPTRAKGHLVTAQGSGSARHNLRIGLGILALLGFYSVLGQVGSALDSYFHLKHTPTRVDYDTVWCRPGKYKKGIPKTRTELHPTMARLSTPCASALYGLAVSFDQAPGRYFWLRTLRNKLQHHVAVVSDVKHESSYYAVLESKELRQGAIEMGRIARAAIWYFGGTIRRKEYERLQRAKRGGRQIRNDGDLPILRV